MKQIYTFLLMICVSLPLFSDILTVTNTNDSGIGSLRRMVEIANDGDSIIFDKTLAGDTIKFLSSININNNLAINGSDAPDIVLSGESKNSIFLTEGDISLYNLRFTNAKIAIKQNSNYIKIIKCNFAENESAAIFCTSDSLSIENCGFFNHIKGSSVIYAQSSSSLALTIADCTFRNNKIISIYNKTISSYFESANLTSIIKNCLFEDNKGTVIYNYSYSPEKAQHTSSLLSNITDCAFKNNIAENGGAVYNESNSYSSYLHYSSNLTSNISDCIFENNKVTKKGGAIYNHSSASTHGFQSYISNCVFDNNQANENGNDIYNFHSSYLTGYLNIISCTFKNNHAIKSCEAIYHNAWTGLSLNNCSFENYSSENGGAVYSNISNNFSPSHFKITNCLFKNNLTIKKGGAIYNSSSGSLIIANSTFENNSATENGGAIYNNSTSSSTVSNSTFGNNLTAEGGGAIYNSSYASLSVTNSTFKDNSATENGGAILSSSTPSVVANCTFSNNLAGNGGAIHGKSSIKGCIFTNNKIVPDNILNDVKDGTSLGYNVYTSNQNSIFSQSTDFRYTDSKSLLLPLGNHGGDTPTMPIDTTILEWKSIVARVPIEELLTTTDQRGFLLPTSGMACAGSVEMQENEDYTGIESTIESKMYVYPNPTKDIIYFSIDKDIDVFLYNTLGRRLLFKHCKTGDNSINIEKYDKGIYFLIIDKKVTKIIKE